MLALIAVLVAALVVSLAVTGVAMFVGLRTKSPTVRRAVRGFNRTVVNPRMLKKAGAPGAYASIIHHVGRTTGRPYSTPVVAEPAGDGFVIALPYGRTSNWVKNVLASGSATIVEEGVTYRVEEPEIVPLSSMADCFPEKDRRSFARFRVDECLRFRRAARREAAEPPVLTPAGR